MWVRWLRDSTANLLAVVPAVGEAVAVRELTFHQVPLGMAAAVTVVDLTMELASQLVFTFLGVAILIAERPGEATGWWLALGLAICTAGIAGFIVAQQRGLFRFLETLPERLGWTRAWGGLSDSVGIHAAIQEIYRHRKRVAANFALHLAAWLISAGETWVGLWFMGHPVSVADALVIESMVYALRTAAFVVPWAAGVQEGGVHRCGCSLRIVAAGCPWPVALAACPRDRDGRAEPHHLAVFGTVAAVAKSRPLTSGALIAAAAVSGDPTPRLGARADD